MSIRETITYSGICFAGCGNLLHLLNGSDLHLGVSESSRGDPVEKLHLIVLFLGRFGVA